MIDKVAFQAALGEALKSGQFDKIAEALKPYIRATVYEQSFIEKVLREKPVTQNELIPEVGKNDTVYVIGQLEHSTEKAVVMSFQSEPFTYTLGGQRYKIPLGMNSTKIFTKSQIEMMAYDYDLFEDVAEKEVFELHRLRDYKLISMLNAATSLSGKVVTFNAPDSNTVVHLEKDHLVAVTNMLETGDRQGIPDEKTLICKKYLMSQKLF